MFVLTDEKKSVYDFTFSINGFANEQIFSHEQFHIIYIRKKKTQGKLESTHFHCNCTIKKHIF